MLRSCVALLAITFLLALFTLVSYRVGEANARAETQATLFAKEQKWRELADAYRKAEVYQYYRGIYDFCLVFGIGTLDTCNQGVSIAAASGNWFQEPSGGFVWPPLPVPADSASQNPRN